MHIYCFLFINISSLNIYSYNYCHGARGLMIFREGDINGEDNIYDLFPNVVVHCIDIYAENRIHLLVLYNVYKKQMDV